MSMKELNWKTWLVHGDQYLNAASPKKTTNVFNTEILYNMLSMSLESYIMAILDFHKTLPDNHTYTDLMCALDRVMTIDTGLKEKILKYENIQSICSIDKYERRAPNQEEINELKGAIVQMGEIAHKTCA